MHRVPSTRWRALSRELLGVDLRSLALARIGLGLVILAELAYRSRTIDTFYTDRGFLPRALLAREVPELASPLSLHALGGSWEWQIALFGLGMACALALALGYRTRFATVASWVLLTSLHLRQPFALNGGDHLARFALLWGMFLPLGARFSLDARRRPESVPRSPQLCHAATAALLVQIAIVYVSAGAVKTSPQWREMGNALQWVMTEPQFTTALGRAAAGFPELLRVLTFGVRYVELLAPLLLFVPFWNGPLRSLAALLLLSMQLGIGLTMKLGFFPAVSFATALVLVPGWLWQRLGAAPAPPGADAASTAPGGRTRRDRARDAVVLALLAWVSWLNLGGHVPALRAPQPIRTLAHRFRLDQRWDMYYTVRRAEFVYDLVGVLRDGRQVSLTSEGYGPGWRSVQRARFRDHYFKEFWFSLRGSEASSFLVPAVASWLCRQWNADAPPEARMASLELFFLVRHLSLSGDHEPWSATRVLDHTCEDEPGGQSPNAPCEPGGLSPNEPCEPRGRAPGEPWARGQSSWVRK